ncbi:phage terminase large subunit [Entomomonas sp. E2T0]|uniref:phage terminase large subunit n=1 Tax=Entomomonas sp. E2T0 TaxID=2930213 RepID=UPI002228170B|nr:phage terminase large subunit [Entomomonas sp. E2T0]
MAIIDDPIKDAKEANSATIRNAIWGWYTTTLYTRLSPNSGILLGMTRWHQDDLAGRLIAEMEKGEGDQWKIIRFPAIAEIDEQFRKIGEPLHPERFTLERLNKIKSAVGTTTWNSFYQQRPTTAGGGVIKGSWFKRYEILPRIKRVAIFADTAQKVKTQNDYTVFLVVGLGHDSNLYIIDVVRGKWEAPDLFRTAKDVWNKYADKRPTAIHIEDKSSGSSLIQTLNKFTKIPVKPIQTDTDKYTRVLGVQGYIESGFVFLPANASWVRDFIDECEDFTATDSHLHDDQVDTLVMAINHFLGGSVTIWDSL